MSAHVPQCNRPPFGWWCTRLAGHQGPCPTWAHWWNLRAPRELRKRRVA